MANHPANGSGGGAIGGAFGAPAFGGLLGNPSGAPVVKAADKPAAQVGQTIHQAANTAGDITTFLTSGKNWIRMGEVVAGVILIVMGLHQLTGIGSGAGTVVKAAAKVAR